MSRDDKPCQKFNLVVYYENGKRLKKPLFHENVYIYSEQNDIYAYDVVRFDTEQEDQIVEIMYTVINTSFKYNGIYVSGLEIVKADFCYQHWLITNLSREELEKENWYGY